MHALVLLVVIFFYSSEPEPTIKVFRNDGGDMASCRRAAQAVKAMIESHPEVRDVEVSCIERKDKV